MWPLRGSTTAVTGWLNVSCFWQRWRLFHDGRCTESWMCFATWPGLTSSFRFARRKIVPHLCAGTGCGFKGTSYEEISILTTTELSCFPQSQQSRVEQLKSDTQTGPISPQCSWTVHKHRDDLQKCIQSSQEWGRHVVQDCVTAWFNLLHLAQIKWL